MRNRKLFIAIGLVIILFLTASMFLKTANRGSRGAASSDKTGKRKILYYKAPMDPTYISDKPGKSPMGMDLIPVYEGDKSADTGGVRINPVTVQNIGVRTELIKRGSLARKIRTVGKIDYDERKIAYVNTKIGGWIEKLYVDYTGQSVEKGDKLLDIYSPELVATEEEYILAVKYNEKIKETEFKEVKERAEALLESSRKRLEYWDISDEQIESLKKTGKAKKTLTIYSPAKGVVIHKNALEGKYTKPGENLYRIADISRIWVYADVYEYELPWVETGQRAEMSLSYLPGKIFKGKVTYLYPYLEAKTRTAKVRMEFDNLKWELKPDMYADVEIYTQPKKEVIIVPVEAVIHSGDRNIVIVDKGKGLFEPREIKLGLETRDYYEALGGVREGERIVISSQFLIDSESRLKEAIAKMLEAKKSKPQKKESPRRGEDIEIKDSTRQVMNNIWKYYFAIGRELADDSLAGIDQNMSLIREGLRKILDSDGPDGIKKLAKEILEGTDRLYPKEKDIAKVREVFLNISNGMIKYMREFDREGSKAKEYKLFFCGMEERYWVQDENKISNPYLGKSMLNCGAQEDY